MGTAMGKAKQPAVAGQGRGGKGHEVTNSKDKAKMRGRTPKEPAWQGEGQTKRVGTSGAYHCTSEWNAGTGKGNQHD